MELSTGYQNVALVAFYILPRSRGGRATQQNSPPAISRHLKRPMNGRRTLWRPICICRR